MNREAPSLHVTDLDRLIRQDLIVLRYRRGDTLAAIGEEFGITKQAVSLILAKAGISPAQERLRDIKERELRRERRRERDAAARASQYRREVERLCSQIGYVPLTTELQRDHRTLAFNLARELDGKSVASYLDGLAQQLGLIRRTSVVGHPTVFIQRVRAAMATARIFRVPAQLYLHTRLRFDFRELRYARYPFDVTEVILDPSEPRFGSDSGETRTERAIYVREGETHTVYTIWRNEGRRFISAGEMVFSESSDEDITYSGLPEQTGLRIEEAATYWLGLVNLCHLLANRTSVDLVRTDSEGALVTRQQARAAEREGKAPHYAIVLRPGVTRRTISHELSAARIETIRAHPRAHEVARHLRRYHTREGVQLREIAPFVRGGKGSSPKVYDARPLYKP